MEQFKQQESPSMSAIVLPFVYRPVGWQYGIKSIPFGGKLALEKEAM